MENKTEGLDAMEEEKNQFTLLKPVKKAKVANSSPYQLLTISSWHSNVKYVRLLNISIYSAYI